MLLPFSTRRLEDDVQVEQVEEVGQGQGDGQCLFHLAPPSPSQWPGACALSTGDPYNIVLICSRCRFLSTSWRM